MRKVFFILLLLSLTTGTLLAGGDELTGKDFVELGELQLVSGTLIYQDDEWYLENGDTIYEIHLGDHDYRENMNFDFENGDEAVVCGFKYNNEIAVVFMARKDYTNQFRTIEGKPLWAGQGKANKEEIEVEEGWVQDSFGE